MLQTMAAYEPNTLGANPLLDSYRYGSSIVNPQTFPFKPLRIYLFGYPIAHSLGPLLQSTLFEELSVPWTYTLFESLSAAEFLSKLKAADCIGSAITMPHKVTFVQHVDDLTDEARAIGAINTVFLRRSANGSTRYVGTNTDCIGVREAFLQNVPQVRARSGGRPALIIGGGGACRAAVYTLRRWMGSSHIYLVNRLKSEVQAVIDHFESVPEFAGKLLHVQTLEEATKLETPVLVVGCVPDFPPKERAEILTRDLALVFLRRPEKGHVLEMAYHPRPITAFYSLARENGWDVLSGTEPLIYQGIAQQSLWMERPSAEFPVQGARRVIKQALKVAHDHLEMLSENESKGPGGGQMV